MPTTINDLSNELLHQIIDELDKPGWPIEILFNAALVCHRFHDLAHSNIFRELTLPLGTGLPKFTKALLQHLQSPEGQNMRNAVEHIVVTASRALSPNDLYTDFMAVLPQFPKLDTITIVPHSTASSGQYKTLKDIPGPLLACIDHLYPRVSVGIQLCGKLSDCQKILSDYSSFHGLNLRADTAWNIQRPDDRANVDISCLLRQPSLRSLGLSSGFGWRFTAPQGVTSLQKLNLNALSLNSDEHPEHQTPNHQLLLDSFINLDALRTLRLQKHWVMASVLKDLAGNTPNLERIVINIDRYGGHFGSSTMSEPEYNSMKNFFSMTALDNITLRNITHEAPWLEFVAASGPKLRQLSYHIDYNDWDDIKSSRMSDLNGTGPLKFKMELGVTPDELVKLNMLCPNIVRLGFDLQGVSVAAARCGALDPLLEFHQLRHLRLVFHPDAEPPAETPTDSHENTSNVVASFSGSDIMHHEVPATPPHTFSSDELELVSGPDLVKLFLHLHDRKKGNSLETLLYRHGTKRGTEDVMVWWMGGQRILLSYRYKGERFEVREMYEGTKLRSMRKRVVEGGTLLSDEVFPG